MEGRGWIREENVGSEWVVYRCCGGDDGNDGDKGSSGVYGGYG